MPSNIQVRMRWACHITVLRPIRYCSSFSMTLNWFFEGNPWVTCDRHIPTRTHKQPKPNPAKTHTHGMGMGFCWVGYGCGSWYPWVTQAIHYKIQRWLPPVSGPPHHSRALYALNQTSWKHRQLVSKFKDKIQCCLCAANRNGDDVITIAPTGSGKSITHYCHCDT